MDLVAATVGAAAARARLARAQPVRPLEAAQAERQTAVRAATRPRQRVLNQAAAGGRSNPRAGRRAEPGSSIYQFSAFLDLPPANDNFTLVSEAV